MSDEYDAFLQDCMTQLPSSTPNSIEPELAIILRDFLQQTSAWRQLYEVPVNTERTCYVIQPLQGSAINLLHALFDSTDAERRPVAPHGGMQMRVPGQLQFKHPPSAAATWVADVSLYPVRNISGTECKALVPTYVLDRYYDTLLHGVLGRMMRQLMKPYSNIQLGTLHGSAYGAGRSMAKADLARSNLWGTQQWVFPAATTARGRQVGS